MKKNSERKTRKYTEMEWRGRAMELFGDDPLAWRFKCPICGHVQTVASLKKYKGKGATPNSAYQECVGRFAGGKRALSLDGDEGGSGPGCDYAAYGLFKLGDEVGGTPVFPFDEEVK